MDRAGTGVQLQGTVKIYGLTEVGELASRGSETVAKRGWSQFTGHFRVRSLNSVCLSPDACMSMAASRSFGIWCWWQDQARPIAESSAVLSYFWVCSRNDSWCVSCLDMRLCSLYGFPCSWTILGFQSLLCGSPNPTKSHLSFDGCQVVVIEVGISNGHLIQLYYWCRYCILSGWLYILLMLNSKQSYPS